MILAAVYSKKSFKDWAPLAIGTTLGFIVMVGGPLTGGCYNPARWFGAALVSNDWGDVWPYLVGPIVGALLAVAVFRFVLEAGVCGSDRAAGAGQGACAVGEMPAPRPPGQTVRQSDLPRGGPSEPPRLRRAMPGGCFAE